MQLPTTILTTLTLTLLTGTLASPTPLAARTTSCGPTQTFSCCDAFTTILGISIPIGINCVLGPLVGSCSAKSACCTGDFNPTTNALIVIGPFNLQCINIL